MFEGSETSGSSY